MNTFFDWWYATSPRIRLFGWTLWLLVLFTLLFLSLARQEESDALTRLRATNHQQSVALYRPVDTTLISEEKTLPFSPLDFQLPGAQLVYWHPSAQGRRVGVENALGSGAVCIYTPGRTQCQREPFFVKRGR